MGPNYIPPGVGHLTDSWQGEVAPQETEPDCSKGEWWTSFQDPVLESLIQLAVSDNLDLKQSLARIQQASAQVATDRGSYLPLVNVNGYAEALKWNFSSNRSLPIVLDPPVGIFYGNTNFNWEMDLFGKISRTVEASCADWQASINSFQGLQLVLFAEIANNYVNFRTLQRRIHYAKRNIEIQRQTLQLTKDQFEQGIAPEVDLVRAKTNLYTTEAQLPSLLLSLEQAKNRLAVLVGRQAGTLNELLEQESKPHFPHDTYIGIPLDVARQRPDVREAERNLASKTARIGIQTADLFPQFSLFGSFTGIGVPTEGGNRIKLSILGIGPAFTWDIFSGFKTVNKIKGARAAADEAFWNYHQTILTATQEVEDSIAGINEGLLRNITLGAAASAAEDSARMITLNYKHGLVDFQAVLDAERTLFTQQDQYADSYGQLLSQYIALFKALGGNW